MKKGILLQLRQMLLLLSALAFNLFFKPLEYPIYRARLSELIFGLLSLKKHSSFFLLRLGGKAQTQNGNVASWGQVENIAVGSCGCERKEQEEKWKGSV